MKIFKIITLIVCVALLLSVMGIRMYYRKDGTITAEGFAVYGIKNGTAIECGSDIDGITVSIPSDLSPDNVVSVSSNPNAAYLELDRSSVGDDRVMRAKLIAVSEGIAELSVRSAKDERESFKYTVNVYVGESSAEVTDEVTETDAGTEMRDPEVVYVYVTRTGTKYHLKESCAGAAVEITLEEAVNEGYKPCKICAVNK